MKIKVFFLAFFAIVSTTLLDAEKICGIVYSMSTVEPLSKVNVTITDTQVKIESDESGNYCLDIDDNLMNDTIKFSFDGYLTESVNVAELKRRECKSIFLNAK